MILVTSLPVCHTGWNLPRTLTLSGRDEEDDSPEQPWLWIWEAGVNAGKPLVLRAQEAK